jgi:hypothetical protein
VHVSVPVLPPPVVACAAVPAEETERSGLHCAGNQYMRGVQLPVLVEWSSLRTGCWEPWSDRLPVRRTGHAAALAQSTPAAAITMRYESFMLRSFGLLEGAIDYPLIRPDAT